MIKNQRQDGVWSAVVYLRLSKEDGDRDRKDESNSIRNQRDLALDFVSRNPDIHVVHILTDDGATGANFNRDAFQAMIAHIENGDVNCIIVKDFSRFSREHIGALKYIQRYFVDKNVRFIAINDGYDGLTADMDDTNTSLMVPFKTIIGEAVLEDISIKTKTQLDIKRKNGELVCNFAVYGYVKENKRLVSDEYAAEIVRGIFDKKLDGYSDQQIAGALNAKGILSPAEYKKSQGLAYNTPFAKAEKSLWTANAVKRILTNRVYVGALEQGKRTKTSYRMSKFFYKPREAWSVHENDHEPIISQADFDLAQQLMAMDTRVSAHGQLNMFSGFVVCGGCGEPMIARTAKKERKRGGQAGKSSHGQADKSSDHAAKSYLYYICATHKKHGGCRHNSISGALIERFALASIQAHIAGLAAEADMYGNHDNCGVGGGGNNGDNHGDGRIDGGSLGSGVGDSGRGDGGKGNGGFGLDTLQSRKKAAIERLIELQMAVIRDNNGFIVKAYEHLLTGEITEGYYSMFTETFTAKVRDAERNITNLRRDMERIGDDARTRELIERFKAEGSITELNRRIVAGLIERVIVGDNKEIQICFRYGGGVGETGGAGVGMVAGAADGVHIGARDGNVCVTPNSNICVAPDSNICVAPDSNICVTLYNEREIYGHGTTASAFSEMVLNFLPTAKNGAESCVEPSQDSKRAAASFTRLEVM